ncbi:MAG: transposase [Desulfomonile tiedjei]|nr:transposase [Desulfomonile tiedjei]
MKYDSERHNRRSIRLMDYDYSQSGAYFVTICTTDRASVLGEISDGQVSLNELGEIVAETWQWLERHYEYLELDEWLVMPNHLHAIVVIGDSLCRGASGSALIPGGSRTAPTAARRKPLGRLIGSFKTVSTKQINEIRKSPGMGLWQRNYYEHVIRSEKSLNAIREYIEANPFHWQDDPENPDGVG